MTRGQGLDHTQEYQWVKQQNGRYTVFDVPIFATFQDEKRGEVSANDLMEVVRNFQVDKMANYRYPRIHIGHHEGNENRPGAGYMDNLHVQDNTVYADLVEITPEVFQAIQKKMKFPYVSAEYHPDRKKILSLALLESQSPFFSFPLIKLGAQQAAVANFDFGFQPIRLQESPEDISQFQDVQAAWACREQHIHFQENFQGCSCMEDTEKKPEETNPPSESKEPMVEEAPQPYKCQDDIVGLGAKIDRILAQIEKIYAWEKAEHEGGMMDETEENPESPDMMPEQEPGQEEEFALDGSPLRPSKPMKGETPPMKKPSSVAYQAPRDLVRVMQEQNNLLREQDKVIREMGQRIMKLEHTQNFSSDEQKLKKLCDESGLNFQEQSGVLRKFSSQRDRETYLASLAMLKPVAKHPAGAMALTAGNMPMASVDKVMQKYQSEHPQVQQAARDAYQVYQDTMQQPDQNEAKEFQKTWGSVERFVDYVAGQYPADPKVLEKITRR